MGISPDPRVNEYIGFVMLLPLGFGVAFQLPLVHAFPESVWHNLDQRISIEVEDCDSGHFNCQYAINATGSHEYGLDGDPFDPALFYRNPDVQVHAGRKESFQTG